MASSTLSTFVVPITVLLIALGCFSSSSILLALPISTISSGPSFPPIPPLSPPPTLSPDITPLFPTPGGDGPSPSQPPSIPTVPSSLSPPNPDQMGFTPELSMGFAPSEPTPAPSSVAMSPSKSLHSILFLALMALGLLWQLSGL